MGTERVAGVTFYLEDAKLVEGATGFSGKVVLSALVNDIELWEAMTSRLLEGLSLYKGEDFKTQLIRVLQEDQEELKTKMSRLQTSSSAEMERIKQAADKAQAQLQQAHAKIAEQQQTIRGLSDQLSAWDSISADLNELNKALG
jgi:chromosome segregation ATPase